MHAPLRQHDPRRLGRYRVVARLGAGGMGDVYLAQDPQGRAVALKVVRPEYALDEEFRARFRGEVTRARQVPPFCTAEVLDADPDHDPPYLVVEYVDAPNLAEVVQAEGPLTAGRLHGVAIGVATALAAIHGAGVIHRDLKPRNVLLAPGTPKVIDFGIARAFDPTSQHTRTGQMLGTVAYMAPERFDEGGARAITPAADIFAWGAVVTYAGTGRTPFAGDSPPATAMKILTQDPDLTGVPPPLRDMVALALAKEPGDRPTARQLVDLLLAVDDRDYPAMAAALARQPELRAAARDARARPDAALPWSTPFAPAVALHPARPSERPADTPVRARTTGARLAVVGRPPRQDRPGGRGRPRHTLALALTGTAALLVLLGYAANNVLPAVIGAALATAPAQTPTAATSPAVTDPLTAGGGWRDSSDREGSGCTVREGLTAARRTEGAYRCSGPDVPLAGQQHDVEVTARLLHADACAAVWFDGGARGYHVYLCRDGLHVRGTAEPTDVLLPGPVATDQDVRVALGVRGTQLTVRRDDRVVGTVALPDGELAAGTVHLGVVVPAGGADAYRVVFRDVALGTA